MKPISKPQQVILRVPPKNLHMLNTSNEYESTN